jgi:WD40 repeat protein
LRIWSIEGRADRILHRHAGVGSRLAISPDQRLIASSGTDGKVIVSDRGTGESSTLETSNNFMGALAFDSTSAKLLVSSWDGNVYLWDLSTKKRGVWSGHDTSVDDVAFAPGDRPVSGDTRGGIIVWDGNGHPSKRFTGYGKDVWPLLVAPDGQVVTGDDGGDVRAWNLDGAGDRLLGNCGGTVYSMAISSRGVVAAGCGEGQRVSLFPLAQDGAAIPPIGLPRGRQVHLAFSADGRYLAVSAYDYLLVVHDLDTGTTRQLRWDATILKVAFAGTSATLVGATGDGAFLAWDLSTDVQALELMDEQESPIQDLKVAADGKQAYYVLGDGRVGSWTINFRHRLPSVSAEVLPWLSTLTETSTAPGTARP